MNQGMNYSNKCGPSGWRRVSFIVDPGRTNFKTFFVDDGNTRF